jgi:hypothetical protein
MRAGISRGGTGRFGDRYELRLTGIVPQNAMEAGLGLAVGEDPRCFSARGLFFKSRLANVNAFEEFWPSVRDKLFQ